MCEKRRTWFEVESPSRGYCSSPRYWCIGMPEETPTSYGDVPVAVATNTPPFPIKPVQFPMPSAICISNTSGCPRSAVEGARFWLLFVRMKRGKGSVEAQRATEIVSALPLEGIAIVEELANVDDESIGIWF
jgi:hypothetical protein